MQIKFKRDETQHNSLTPEKEVKKTEQFGM